MATSTTPTIHKDTKTDSTDSSGSDGGHKTILHNCNCHDFLSVINQLIYALNCSYEAAKRYTYIAHSNGKVTVFTGSQEACDNVADKLADIGLRVTVTS